MTFTRQFEEAMQKTANLQRRAKRIGDIFENASTNVDTFHDRSRIAREYFEDENAIITYDGCVRKNKHEWIGWNELKAFVEWCEMDMRERS